MKIGRVLDNLPRISLTLPGQSGPITVEFIVDTGFDGELAIPPSLLTRIDAIYVTDRVVRLANGAKYAQGSYLVDLDWDDDARPTEILEIDGVPLLGTELLAGFQIHIEMMDGGEVVIERMD